MAAGEFFDLIRPVVLVLSALLSTWVLSSARKARFRTLVSAAWALGTLLMPPVFFPVYLIARFAKRTPSPDVTHKVASIKQRLLIPLLYLIVVLSIIGWFYYRDTSSVDAHLARATDAKVRGQRNRTINEYRQALTLEDNAHTHKLLALELSEAGRLSEALSELRLAERGGEPDPLIPFRIGMLLDAMNNPNQAALEYKKFLQSDVCTQELPDTPCGHASARIAVIDAETAR
jgi:hypothetical protein